MAIDREEAETVTQIHLRQGTMTRLCKELDCSRDELARRLGVASTTAFRIDSGRVLPSTKFIGSLLDLTGEPFDDLFKVVRSAA